ncbi:AtzE family amidohydrolase [Lichenicoccus sp.]|uniref:AtzE family amidohydrolase n=1 Tax=Lichenicoccus sp. TaxID=2781899 RepID=UPI003D0CAAD4
MTIAAGVAARLAAIERHDPVLNCFTTVLANSARHEAEALDRRIAAGEMPGPLWGVPFAVKDLFDVGGVVTRAGSAILATGAPAARDATVVGRLRAAGAILLGCLNMDEFAYGFTTENAHYGTTANPHATDRIAGGSSGGSAAAVAAGLVAFSLGTDTNGSIRVPASLCGILGLKPTFGRLSRDGVLPFVNSFDHVGPFARTVADLARVYEVMAAAEPPLPAPMPTHPRVGRLVGWFAAGASAQALDAVDRVADALGGAAPVELAETARARSAAFCISAAEGAALHLPRLRAHASQFDPATRDRLLAGALLPAAVVAQAQRLRAWYRAEARRLFERFDMLLAPATPTSAPLRGQPTLIMDGVAVPVRANLGLYTQPISFIGLPVVTVPVRGTGALPIGVQLITRPFEEALGLRIAAELERQAVIGCEPLAYD